MIPRIGAKSSALLYELKDEKVPDVAVLCGKAKHLHSILSLGTGGPAASSGALLPPVAPSSEARRPSAAMRIALARPWRLHCATEPMERQFGTFRTEVAELAV